MNDYYVVQHSENGKYYGFCDTYKNTWYIADTEEKALDGIKWLVGEVKELVNE